MLIITFSVILMVGLDVHGIPVALLLGPFVIAVVAATHGTSIAVPERPYIFAQGVVGCMIGATLTQSIILDLVRNWPLFLAIIIATLMATTVLGWLLCRSGTLPGSTGVWGIAPGGASAMVILGDAVGADGRLIAFMQYFRMVCVIFSASMVAQFLAPGIHRAGAGSVVSTDRRALIRRDTGRGGSWVACRGDFPQQVLPIADYTRGFCSAACFRYPATSAAALVIGRRLCTDWLDDRAAIHASNARSCHASLHTDFSLDCPANSALRYYWLGPRSGHGHRLLTSPGGLDSIALIASPANVDVPFVMAVQSVRLSVIVVFGQPLTTLQVWLATC